MGVMLRSCLSLSLARSLFYDVLATTKAGAGEKKWACALFCCSTQTHTQRINIYRKRRRVPGQLCALLTCIRTHTLTQTHWYVHCYIHMPYELHIIRRVRDSIIHAKRLRRYTCFFVVCACELVWSALKFVYISCLCVCVCFTTNKNNFKCNCSFEPIFHSLHLKLRHSHSQRSQTHRASIELSYSAWKKMKTRNFWENEWKWARWILW